MDTYYDDECTVVQRQSDQYSLDYCYSCWSKKEDTECGMHPNQFNLCMKHYKPLVNSPNVKRRNNYRPPCFPGRCEACVGGTFGHLVFAFTICISCQVEIQQK
jgi:hypothetical protein